MQTVAHTVALRGHDIQGGIELMQIEVALPCTPQIGSMLRLHQDGEYMEVSDVYVDAHRHRLDVYLLNEAPMPRFQELLAQGWIVEGRAI